MLFRLHALFHRLKSRSLAHDTGELEALAGELRLVSDIPTNSDFKPASSTWKIQQNELYEPAEYLNKNHLPLELGDIFEKIGPDSTKRFILLAQPCDLMIRTNGKRQPEVGHLTVAEVVTKAGEPPKYSEELEYYGKNPSEKWYVKLKIVHQVKSCILDLCSYNKDGLAKIEIGGAPPSNIRPSLKGRFGYLESQIKKFVQGLDAIVLKEGDSKETREIKERLKTGLAGRLCNDTLFKGDMDSTNGKILVQFNCRRIGRLSRERAFGLLMSYTSCLARPAYDRDFGMT